MIIPAGPSDLQKKLHDINRVAEERDAERRATRTGQSYIDLSKTPIGLEAIKLLTEEEAKAARAATVELRVNKVALVSENPKSPAVQKIVERLKAQKYEVATFVVSRSSLEQAWYFYKFVAQDAKEITGKVEIEKSGLGEIIGKLNGIVQVEEMLKVAILNKDNTSQLLEIVLGGSLANHASDIHLESEEKGTRIRYRLDGLLHDVYENFPAHTYESIISRIKLLSGLKINIHGEPQDGRFTIQFNEKQIEIRVSIIPSEYGENIVMRVLDPDSIHVDLPGLGLRPDDLALVEAELKKPNGLILNTGPTGSGKTTTLYAFLQKLADPESKIITVEDPIEYRIKGIEQTQVDAEVGYSFASGLRAILRQDPDVILVGEIRDHDTADIAMQASLTGHLVLSTLHTNDAVGAIPRLIDLGIKPATIGPALSLVIAQRLIRKLCSNCRKQVVLGPELKAKIEKYLTQLPPRIDPGAYANPQIFEPVGCEKCNKIGYRGRIGIFEFLRAGREVEKVILEDTSEISLREVAKKQDMVEMQTDGVLKVLGGVTTFEEVEKVTGPIIWG